MMETIENKIFKAHKLSEITDNPTRFEICTFWHPETEGFVIDVQGCEFEACLFSNIGGQVFSEDRTRYKLVS